jgi:hypothetical protein
MVGDIELQIVKIRMLADMRIGSVTAARAEP